MSQVDFAEQYPEVADLNPEPEAVETEAPADVEAEPEVSTTETTPEEEKPEAAKAEEDDPKKWTFQMAMDEREKRQKAVKEAEELRERLKSLEKPEADIDIFEDQDGWKAQVEKRTQEKLTNALLNQSEALAVREFGQEAVAEAVEWFKEAAPKSPFLLERFNSTELKHHAIVDLYAQERERASMADLPAYKAKLKAQLLAELKAETKAETPDESITPSLAGKRGSSVDETAALAADLNDIPLDR